MLQRPELDFYAADLTVRLAHREAETTERSRPPAPHVAECVKESLDGPSASQSGEYRNPPGQRDRGKICSDINRFLIRFELLL